jgi:long-chain acyl-CoA synthetase
MVLSATARKLNKQTLIDSLQTTLDEVNASLESHAVLDSLVVMKDEWTVDNGLLTPTLKVKRHVLEERFAGLINTTMKGKIVIL